MKIGSEDGAWPWFAVVSCTKGVILLINYSTELVLDNDLSGYGFWYQIESGAIQTCRILRPINLA